MGVESSGFVVFGVVGFCVTVVVVCGVVAVVVGVDVFVGGVVCCLKVDDGFCELLFLLFCCFSVFLLLCCWWLVCLLCVSYVLMIVVGLSCTYMLWLLFLLAVAVVVG